MKKRFEVGKSYGAWDSAVPEITIIKRTEKTCTVKNDTATWRMRIRETDEGEIMIDSSVPSQWRDCYTYDTRFEQ